MSGKAEIEISANDSRLASGLAAASNKMRTWAASVARGTSSVMDAAWSRASKAASKFKPGDMLKGAVSHAGGNAISSIASSLTEGAGSALDFERNLMRFQIAGEKTPEQIDKMRTSIRALSLATGVSSSKILEGASSYIAITGDAAGAESSLTTFAHAAVASGAAMGDIAKTTASMHQNLKIDPKDYAKGISVLISQAKAGAVEISDLSEQFAGVAPGFQDFAGAKSVEGMSEMGAALQFVRENFGNADRAATAFNSMTTELDRNMDKLAKAGVNVLDPKTGQKRGFLEIINDIKNSTKLMKPGALIHFLGEEKAVRAIRAVIDNLEDVNRLKETSLRSDALTTDYATAQATAIGRYDVAVNALKESFASAFTPDRIAAFASALGDVAKVLGTIGSAVADVFKKWEQMRKDPHEVATDIAEGTVGLSAKQQDAAAAMNEYKAKALAKPADDARAISSGWFGGLMAVSLPGASQFAGNAIANEQTTYADAGAKQRRQAVLTRANDAERAANRAAAIAGETGYMQQNSPVIDYNAMGRAIAQHLGGIISSLPLPIIRLDGRDLHDAVSRVKGRLAT